MRLSTGHREALSFFLSIFLGLGLTLFGGWALGQGLKAEHFTQHEIDFLVFVTLAAYLGTRLSR